jgi:hypothetical protein
VTFNVGKNVWQSLMMSDLSEEINSMKMVMDKDLRQQR